MKKGILGFILLFSVIIAQADKKTGTFTDQDIEAAIDEVLQKSSELYAYEYLAWYGSDNAAQLVDLAGTKYVVSKNDDGSLSILFYDQSSENCIYSQRLDFNASMLDEPDTTKRALTEKEIRLINIRSKMLTKIHEKADQYELFCPENCSLDVVFIATDSGYELFLFLGTSERGVIPFGGDFVFVADSEGEIQQWCKFHQSAIVNPPIEEGAELSSIKHSHKQYPFVSPTEVCVFMLYGPRLGLNEFSVYSDTIQRKFTYNSDTHKIKIEKL